MLLAAARHVEENLRCCAVAVTITTLEQKPFQKSTLQTDIVNGNQGIYLLNSSKDVRLSQPIIIIGFLLLLQPEKWN